MAKPNVNTPKRPINISKISTHLPKVVKSPVIPLLIPTVPNAEATSNIISPNSKLFVNVIKKVPKTSMLV